VWMDGTLKDEIAYPKVKVNAKWFGGVFLLMGLAFFKWGKGGD